MICGTDVHAVNGNITYTDAINPNRARCEAVGVVGVADVKGFAVVHGRGDVYGTISRVVGR